MMRRSRVNSVWARQAATGELLSPRHVHEPSKHKPAYFFLLNPEVILKPPQPQAVSLRGYQQNAVKLRRALFFLLSDSVLRGFKATFYTKLPLFLALTYKTTNTAGANRTSGTRGLQGDLD